MITAAIAGSLDFLGISDHDNLSGPDLEYGARVHTRQPMTKDVSFTFADNVPAGPKESYYYVRVMQVDDQMAWSSPIWIQRNYSIRSAMLADAVSAPSATYRAVSR